MMGVACGLRVKIISLPNDYEIVNKNTNYYLFTEAWREGLLNFIFFIQMLSKVKFQNYKEIGIDLWKLQMHYLISWK